MEPWMIEQHQRRKTELMLRRDHSLRRNFARVKSSQVPVAKNPPAALPAAEKKPEYTDWLGGVHGIFAGLSAIP